MTARPKQPEPFVRGAPYPATGDVPYPRADPSDLARLPADLWHAATVPVGVRLELVGDAQAVDVAYRTKNGNLGYRGDGAGVTFSVWRAGRQVAEADAELGDGLIRLRLGSTAPERPATIYLPEGMLPLVRSLTAVHGEIAPAPARPRWLAYGDSVTQGWVASGPAQAWAAIAARKAALDLVNMGYAQSGRGEIATAEQMAALDAEVVTISYGSSCWDRLPHSVAMVEAGLDAFLDVVRQGHPETAVVVISPILRPEAEDEPNRLGATLGDIRTAIESVTRWRIGEGDANLALLPGREIVGERHLVDGIYPGDEGHKRIAAAVGKYLFASMRGTLDELARTDLETVGPGAAGPDEAADPDGPEATLGLRRDGHGRRATVDLAARRQGAAAGAEQADEVGDEVDADAATPRRATARSGAARSSRRRSARAPAV